MDERALLDQLREVQRSVNTGVWLLMVIVMLVGIALLKFWFDFRATWAPPHQFHRLGTQADINQEEIPCLTDFALQAAIRAVGARRTCESGGRKHIDF